MPLVEVREDLRQLRFHCGLIEMHDTREKAEDAGIDLLPGKRLHDQRGNKGTQKNPAWVGSDDERKTPDA